MYTFNKIGFEQGLEAIKHEFTMETVAYLTTGAFKPGELSISKLMESMLSSRTTYPEYKHYFEFTTAWVTYKFLKMKNVPEENLGKCKETYTEEWRIILESREQRELP
tara:strand:- start:983 stop:1306 length:324 start_codon:yes stop_codon:yes gene_type:complete